MCDPLCKFACQTMAQSNLVCIQKCGCTVNADIQADLLQCEQQCDAFGLGLTCKQACQCVLKHQKQTVAANQNSFTFVPQFVTNITTPLIDASEQIALTAAEKIVETALNQSQSLFFKEEILSTQANNESFIQSAIILSFVILALALIAGLLYMKNYKQKQVYENDDYFNFGSRTNTSLNERFISIQ
eukprot:403334223